MTLDPNKSPLYVILFAAVVSGAFTCAIMALHVATEPVVQANQKLLRQKALVGLFSLGDVAELTADQIASLVETRIYETTINARSDLETPLLVAFRQPIEVEGRPPIDIHDKAAVAAYAFPISGVGFWARIDGYLAVTPDLSRVVGIVFIAHSETPGLGGRITEPAFREQFKGLPVTPPARGDRFIYIERTSPAPSDPRHKRHVDAITGATGTSTAVDEFLNRDIERFRRAAVQAGLIESGRAGDVHAGRGVQPSP